MRKRFPFGNMCMNKQNKRIETTAMKILIPITIVNYENGEF